MQILIVNKTQFGYHTDVYKWCLYLKRNHKIRLICYDEGKPRINMSGVNVNYARKILGIAKFRIIVFFIVSFFYSLLTNGPVIISYFKGCLFLRKLLPGKRFILDIRTLSVDRNEELRKKENIEIRKACLSFKEITIISEGLKQQLELPEGKKVYLLPLGADVVSTKPKIFDNGIKLLYVGTLTNRHVEKTIEGLSLFFKKNTDINMEYHIVGSGVKDDIEVVNSAIKDSGLHNIIYCHGFVQHEELGRFFDECNIGVSYVPLTPYYQDQPPTKTFEYILSNMFTIATATRSNKGIVSNDNGIIVNDDAESFCIALQYVVDNLSKIRELHVGDTLVEYKWENIVKKYLMPILETNQ